MKGKKTGGRKKGSKNKRTKLLDAQAAKGILPLDYMLKVMRNPKAPPLRRDDLAKAAAPYLHARRAPEDKAGKTVPTMVYLTPPLEEPDSDLPRR
jgi:hypothetical protein